MRIFPTLFDLAMNAVADCFKTGIPPTHHVKISPGVQEKIFETVMRIREYRYDDHTEALIKMFQPIKLQLDFGYRRFGTFTEIKKLKLTELRIKNFEWLSKYCVCQGGISLGHRVIGVGPSDEYFEVGPFLGEILNQETKQGLRVLDITGEHLLGRNWIEELSSMFPNLRDLNISERTLGETNFTTMCNSFPNLQKLDTRRTEITNLNGISQLQNLEYLHIGSLEFETKEDVQDLFELKNLKQLVFGDNASDWNYNWFFEKSFPELRTLCCKWGEANNAFLQRILPKFSKLKTVVAHETKITQAAALPGIILYTAETIEECIKSTEYLRSQGNFEEEMMVFDRLNDTLYKLPEAEFTPERMTLMVNELEVVIRDFKLGKRGKPDEAESLLKSLPDFINSDSHLKEYKPRILNILLMDLGHHLKKGTHLNDYIFELLWNAIEPLTRTTEIVHIDDLCSLAMKSIIRGHGIHDWELLCVVVLETFIDRMDLSSEYYQNINFRKLHEYLSVIKKRTDLLVERKTSAGNVLKFVERFM